MYRVLAFLRKLDSLVLKQTVRHLVDLSQEELLEFKDKLPRNDVDTTRSISLMCSSDIWCLLDLLVFDKRTRFIVLHYNEEAFKTNSYVRNRSDDRIFSIYQGILRECRGIMVDLSQFAVVTLPFPKFYKWDSPDDVLITEMVNHAEYTQAPIQVSEKKDGRFIQATCWDNNLVVATEFGFMDSAERRAFLNQPNHRKFLAEHPGDTMLFVHTCRKEPELVDYLDDELGYYLVGIRSNQTGKFATYLSIARQAMDYNIKTAKYRGDMSWQDVFEDVHLMAAKNGKGYVVYVNGELVSVTTENYLRCQELLMRPGWEENLVLAIARNDYAKFMQYVPEWLREEVEAVHSELMEYERGMQQLLDKYVADWRDFNGSLDNLVDFMSEIPAPIKGAFSRVANTKFDPNSDPNLNWFMQGFRVDGIGCLSLAQIRKYKKEFLS